MKEVDRWSIVHESAKAIHEFVDYLNENQISIGSISDNGLFLPTGKTLDDMIYECYGINPVKLEQERREILETARKQVSIH